MPENEPFESNANPMLPASEGRQRLRYRPWPCESCSEGLTPVGYLFRCIEAGSCSVRGDEGIAAQRRALIDWVSHCPHLALQVLDLRPLATGSEHAVAFREEDVSVVKVTLPHNQFEIWVGDTRDENFC
jgi:hypothetical protein